MIRRLIAAALFAAAVAPNALAERLPVTATFSILADMTARVGGEHVEVTALVGPNGDSHVFNPAPADLAKLGQARVFVVNGLGLEAWAERSAKAANFAGVNVTAAAGVTPLAPDDSHAHGDHGHDHGHAHNHGGVDPHAWQDVRNAIVYVRNIAEGLSKADPANAAAYEANAAAYIAELEALHVWATTEVARIPEARRKIVTSHDAFAYFGAAYGVTFHSAAGVSTETEAGAGDLARLVDLMRREGAKAVFMENMTDPRVIETVAKETGAVVGGKLYADALSEPGGAAPTYIEMIRHNVTVLTGALTQG